MFCLTNILIRSDWTCTNVYSIIDPSSNTGCNPGISFYSNYWIHLHNTSHTWGIFYLSNFSIFNSSSRALSVKFQFVYVFYNPRGIINNCILWKWPHLQMDFSLTVFWPRKINICSWLYFSSKIVSCYYLISIPHLLNCIVNRWASHSFICEMFWFHSITIVIKVLCFVCFINI